MGSASLRHGIGRSYLAFQGVLFGVPVALLAVTSLRRYELGQPSGSLTLANYQAVLESDVFVPALGRSIALASIIATLASIVALATVLGTWRLAWRRARRVILLGCALMFFAGMVPRTFANEFLLSAHGPLGGVWGALGVGSGGSALYTGFGIVLASLPLITPLCIVMLYVARQAVPEEYLEAGRDLSASWWRLQWQIVVPLMRPGLIVSLVVSLILALGDVVVVDLVGGSQVYTAALCILDYVKIDDWGMAAAASSIVLFVVTAVIGGATWLLLRCL